MHIPTQSWGCAIDVNRGKQRGFPVSAGILLGLGLGGFFHGIV
jgi:uncharacterized membrane protein